MERAEEHDADDGVPGAWGQFFGAGDEISGGVVDENVERADFQMVSIRVSTASRLRTSQGRAWMGPWARSSAAVFCSTSSRRPQM